MAHEWHKGVLTTSSWHGLEDIGVMSTADDLIAAGTNCNAWPVALGFEGLRSESGLYLDSLKALVATYRDDTRCIVGAVGSYYRPTAVEEWADLCRAAVAAGAMPTGAFALRGGSRVIATFDVGGADIRTQLVIADSFDRSLKLTVGTTSIRVVCANTMSAAMRRDGEGMARLIHTASLETKVNVLREAIGETMRTGEKTRDTYATALAAKLTHNQATAVFDLLFPEATDDASKFAKTRAENARNEARIAAAMPINNAGNSVATLWNAATYLVDRNADASARENRGETDRLESLLLGSRARRIDEVESIVQKTIEIMLTDGTIERVSAQEAVSMGIDSRQVGRSIIADLMDLPASEAIGAN